MACGARSGLKLDKGQKIADIILRLNGKLFETEWGKSNSARGYFELAFFPASWACQADLWCVFVQMCAKDFHCVDGVCGQNCGQVRTVLMETIVLLWTVIHILHKLYTEYPQRAVAVVL